MEEGIGIKTFGTLEWNEWSCSFLAIERQRESFLRADKAGFPPLLFGSANWPGESWNGVRMGRSCGMANGAVKEKI